MDDAYTPAEVPPDFYDDEFVAGAHPGDDIEPDYDRDWDYEPHHTDMPEIRHSVADNSDDVRAEALASWYAVAAAALQTGENAPRARDLVDQLTSATTLYEAIGDDHGDVCKRTLNLVAAVLGDMHAGEVWLDSLGLLDNRRVANDVKECLTRIANTVPEAHPESRLAGAMSASRKQLSRDGAVRLVSAIDAGATPTELAEAHAAIVPPAALDAGASSMDNATVADLFAANTGQGEGLTLSSGMRTLDLVMHTREEFPIGFSRAGQLVVVAAPSGSGKTSWLNTVIPAMTIDALRQGHLGRGMFVHVEDETLDLFKAMGVAPGGRFADIADKISATKTSSREELTKLFYREVLWAKRRSAETGLPVSLFMPPYLILDYFQALSDAMDNGNDTLSTSRTADLLLYGFANCDPVACKTFSGLGFQEYTGESWPQGLEGYGVAVVTTAQLLLKGVAAPYDPDKHDWRGYAVATPDDSPAWELKAGDAPLSKLDDIRGSSKIVQHATTILGLHRSRPRSNPVVGVTPEGYETLADTRGFFLILKARYGQKMVTIPMEFNRQRNGGSKAQYIDAGFEYAMGRRKASWDTEVFRQSGDPILPVRERQSRMRHVRY